MSDIPWKSVRDDPPAEGWLCVFKADDAGAATWVEKARKPPWHQYKEGDRFLWLPISVVEPYTVTRWPAATRRESHLLENTSELYGKGLGRLAKASERVKENEETLTRLNKPMPLPPGERYREGFENVVDEINSEGEPSPSVEKLLRAHKALDEAKLEIPTPIYPSWDQFMEEVEELAGLKVEVDALRKERAATGTNKLIAENEMWQLHKEVEELKAEVDFLKQERLRRAQQALEDAKDKEEEMATYKDILDLKNRVDKLERK